MQRDEITDTFLVADEVGNRYSVQEITVHRAPDDESCAPSYVYYQFPDGRRLSAYLGSREFQDEESGVLYDRV